MRLDVDGSRRYYVNGIPTYAGLVYWEGYYYYFNSSKTAVKSRTYWITKNNDLLPAATYSFDDQGRITDLPGSSADLEIAFTYDANGMRVGKSITAAYRLIDGEVNYDYSYIYNGGSLTQMVRTKTAADGTKTTDTLYFTYAGGTPQTVTHNGTVYYYVTNLQGDIVAILDGTGTAVVEYTYNAWGLILGVGGTGASTIGNLNPLRYRGYVYDTETGLYYLQSRYYDPEVGRFLNADALIATGQGILGNNMFVYCLNNPVRYEDSQGNIAYDSVDEDANNDENVFNDTARIGNQSFKSYQTNSANTLNNRERGYTNSNNPWGRHGSPLHRQMINMLRHFFEDMGYRVSAGETRVYIGDSNKYRYPDLIVSDENGTVRYVQVGRATSSGDPVPREAQAMSDLEQNGIEVWFVPYN